MKLRKFYISLLTCDMIDDVLASNGWVIRGSQWFGFVSKVTRYRKVCTTKAKNQPSRRISTIRR